MPTDNSINSTTQQYLDIYDITNDLVILKDGSASVILTVSALNFGLLAEEEQDAIIYSYAGLLNSINYTIQILVKSQTKDVTNYLHLLKDQEEQAQDRLKQGNISRYREFVSNLIQERNVLDKKFYVVITASPIEMGVVSAQSVVPGVKSPEISNLEKSVIVERAKNNLEPKKDHLVAQFGRIGLYSRQLRTQEIIQLFYVSYNPEAAEGQQLTDSKNYTTPLVKASVQGDIMNDQNPATANQTVANSQPTPASQPPMAASNPVPAPAPQGMAQPPRAAVPAEQNTKPNPVDQTAATTPSPKTPSPDEVIAAASAPPAQSVQAQPATPNTPVVPDLQKEIDGAIEQMGSQPATPASTQPVQTAPTMPTNEPTPVQPIPQQPVVAQPTPDQASTNQNMPELPEI